MVISIAIPLLHKEYNQPKYKQISINFHTVPAYGASYEKPF